MTALAVTLLLLPVLIFGYAYVLYPVVLWVAARDRRPSSTAADPLQWPTVTITVPVYNEERSIRQKLEELLQLDYPSDRRQILVISDASTDRTDEIVREFADRGVELLRLARRSGKSAAENAAGAAARGEIIVNNDATVGIPPHALKSLVRAFGDPTVGVASGRDVSVGDVRVD